MITLKDLGLEGVDIDNLLGGMSRKDKIDFLQMMDEVERRNCEESFAHFCKTAWDVIEPATPLQWNWHMTVICDELQREAERVSRGETKTHDLAITVPPRSAKSTICTKMFQPWCWIKWPWMRFMTISHSQKLTFEHTVDSRRICLSTWYQKHWSGVFRYMTDMNNKALSQNDKYGARMATSVEAGIIGSGGHFVIGDDLLSVEDSISDLRRETANRVWTKTVKTRLNDPKIGIFILIMQRLHEDDPVGRVLSNPKNRYKLLCFPAELTKDVCPAEYRSKYTHGLLFPERLPKDVLDDFREGQEFEYAGQFLQNPAPLEGGIFKRSAWKFWVPQGSTLPSPTVKVDGKDEPAEVVVLPNKFDDVITSWDATFKDHDESDYVCGQVWGYLGTDEFLLDQYLKQASFSATCEAMLDVSNRHPDVTAHLIEDKANGPAIISELSNILPGLTPITPKSGKYARAQPLAKCQNNGKVILPHPALAAWVNKFIETFSNFPAVANDDEIDSASQAHEHYFRKKSVLPFFRNETSNYKINFREIERDTRTIISVWIERDGTTNAVAATWNARKKMLCPFYAIEMPMSSPEVVIAGMSKAVKRISENVVMNLKKWDWYANGAAFSQSGGDIRTAFAKYNISLVEPINYDEPGAITLLQRVMFKRGLKVHSRCGELSRHLKTWKYHNGKPEKGYGYARCLCNIMAILQESNSMEPQKKPFKPYSVRHTLYQEEMGKLAREGNFKERVRRQITGSKKTQSETKGLI